MTIFRRIRPALVVTAGIGCFAATGAPWAAQWYAKPSLVLQAGWEDNFLRAGSANAGQNTYAATPRIEVSSLTENSAVQASAYATSYKYPGRGELDNTGAGASATLNRNYERFGWNLDGGLARTVLLSYQNIDVDASRFADDTMTRSTSATPTLRWSLTPRFFVSAATSYSDVEYAGSRAQLYRDYRVNAPSLTANYAWSEITQFYATASDSLIEYTNTDFPVTSETQSGYVGVNTRLSELFDLNVSAGTRRTTNDTTQLQPVCLVFVGSLCAVPPVILPVETTTLREGRVYNANLTWRYENGAITGRAAQNIVPSGQAASILSTTFSGTIAHDFSPRFGAQFSVTSSRYRTDANTLVLNPNVNYDFLRVEPALSWRISEPWTARLSYGRSRYNYVTLATELAYNSAYLTLSWRPERKYVSY